MIVPTTDPYDADTHEVDPSDTDPYEEWREEAACTSRALDADFFPSPDDRAAIARAIAVCASCPVAAECLAFAVETGQDEGIWGGTTPAERRRLHRLWLRDVRQAS